MDREELEGKIDIIMTQGRGDKINLCYAVFCLIAEADNGIQPFGFRHMAEIYDYASSSETISINNYISSNRLSELKTKYMKFSDEYLKTITSENLSEEDFYTTIWMFINSPLFPSVEHKAYAMYNILEDKIIPYFRIDSGLTMSNDDFKAMQIKCRSVWQKVRHIMYRDFDQRTQRASLIIKELDKLDSDEERPVVMARIISDTRSPLGNLTTMLHQIKDIAQ